jgi:hypothetical protein
MADQGQQQQPAVRRGGGAAGRGRGGGNAAVKGAPQMVFLSPERAPPLITKWQKLLGKDLEKIEVTYEENGVSVFLYGKEGTPFAEKKDKDGDVLSISVAEYKAIKEKTVQPSSEDAIFAFKNKFEVRLNQEFPAGVDLGDGSEAALRSAVQALPFDQRRVMLMSNKQFKSAYPNGFAGAAGAAA